jgi:hypothetical protein
MSEAQRPAPPPAPPVTDVNFTDEMKEVVGSSYGAGAPALVAYVAEDGQPSLSIRGSTQVYSDNQIAVWVRAGSNMAKALEKNNRVSVLIRIPETRATLNIRGRATLSSDEAVRQKVWSSAPENEQKADPEMKGQPMIIDVDRVDGRVPSGPLRQLRGS